jgi:hypothetical protein
LKKTGTLLLITAALSVALASAAFAQGGGQQNQQRATFVAALAPLNGSGATGTAALDLKGNRLGTYVASEGLAENLPHAQHIHGRAQAESECPTIAADAPPNGNGDGLVNTAEGLPDYGPILVSLTTEGDTSPASGLAVDRFPVAEADGSLEYSRTFAVKGRVGANLDELHIVQHGVDLNNNGVYDFEAAGASELDPSLPQEATIPASCGKIEPIDG